MVGLGVVVCASLAAAVTLAGPKTYESSVTVLVFPPVFKETELKPSQAPLPTSKTMEDLAELMPRTLPVETYSILAQSKWMFAQIKAKLESPKYDSHDFDIKDMKIEDIQKKCRVQLSQLGSRTPQFGVRYSQAMMFIAKAKTPELAAAIAQEWVGLFKDKVDALTKTGRDQTMALVEQMWEGAKKDLEGAEDEIEMLDVKWNLPLMQQRLERKQLDLTTFESQLDTVEIRIATQSSSLKQIQEELAKEEKKETLFRAPPEEVYWDQKLAATTGVGETLGPKDGLRTESLNPNYTVFREQEVTALGILEGLRAERTTTLVKIEKLNAEVQQLRKDFTEQNVVRTRLVRDRDSYKERYTLVARNLEATKIAKMNEESDIEIAADAVLAGRSAGVGGMAKVASAAVVGALLGIGYVVASASLAGTLPGQTTAETAT